MRAVKQNDKTIECSYLCGFQSGFMQPALQSIKLRLFLRVATDQSEGTVGVKEVLQQQLLGRESALVLFDD